MVLGAAPAGCRVWFAPMVVLSRALQTSSTPQQATHRADIFLPAVTGSLTPRPY